MNTIECECLFCYKPATARLTAPRIKPRVFMCDTHLAETLVWAEPYRKMPGRVLIEPLADCS